MNYTLQTFIHMHIQHYTLMHNVNFLYYMMSVLHYSMFTDTTWMVIPIQFFVHLLFRIFMYVNSFISDGWQSNHYMTIYSLLNPIFGVLVF